MAGRWGLRLRRWHYWVSAFIALPLSLVIATGLLLLIKKQWSWVQPPTRRGQEGAPRLSFEQVLAAARSVKEAGVQSWSDIDRLDVRPDKGVIKVRAKSRWEVQVDARSGAVLHIAYRRSDFIEELHDGSFFGLKLWLFLPAALGLLFLWGSGLYLFAQPILVRRRRARSALKDERTSS